MPWMVENAIESFKFGIFNTMDGSEDDLGYESEDGAEFNTPQPEWNAQMVSVMKFAMYSKNFWILTVIMVMYLMGFRGGRGCLIFNIGDVKIV